MVLAIALKGNRRDTVGGLVLKEISFALLHDTDHGVIDSIDHDSFSERVLVLEESVVNVVADHDYVGPVDVIGFGEIAAFLQSNVVNIGIRGQRARVVDVENLFALVPRRGRSKRASPQI